MLTRAVQRAARCPLHPHLGAPASLSARPLPLPLPQPALLLSRCLLSLSAPPPPPTHDEDAGAPFVQDGLHEEDPRSQSHSESLSAASGSFTRQQPGGLNILPPRARGSPSSAPRSRADDPASANLLRQMQRTAVQSHTDTSVPIGAPGVGASSRPRPQKGGRPIQPASVREQHGQLTPLQMHRVLSSTKAEAEAATAAAAAAGGGVAPPSYWTDERVARAYSIDTAAVTNIRKHLSLPFVMSRDGGMLWLGTTEVPVSVQLQRSLGHAETEPLRFLGHHLAIEKTTDDGEQGKGRE